MDDKSVERNFLAFMLHSSFLVPVVAESTRIRPSECERVFYCLTLQDECLYSVSICSTHLAVAGCAESSPNNKSEPHRRAHQWRTLTHRTVYSLSLPARRHEFSSAGDPVCWDTPYTVVWVVVYVLWYLLYCVLWGYMYVRSGAWEHNICTLLHTCL